MTIITLGFILQVFSDEVDHEFEEVEKQETSESAFDIKVKY